MALRTGRSSFFLELRTREGLGNKGLPPYKHIQRNEFTHRKHTKQKEVDIAICDCQYNPNDQESACGEHCLNVLTSTECTPGYCPCGDDCMNQKFQKCQYVKSILSQSEGCGWGLLADEDIKAGQFVIEYSGEVITWKEAKQRSQVYEAQGLKDAYIISLNAHETIDATWKGNLARFINHSCAPNCETRKWNVLGEIRVGIFAKQDILVGTELSYNYNFEWYGGAKVRCLCEADCCSGFLGAKSRGFQVPGIEERILTLGLMLVTLQHIIVHEDTYVWEDDDSRYSVENIPLYDSTDDEANSTFVNHIALNKSTTAEIELEESLRSTYNTDCDMLSQALPINVEPLSSAPKEIDEAKNEVNEFNNYYTQNVQQNLQQKVTLASRIRGKNVFRSHQIQSNLLPRSSLHCSNGKARHFARRHADVKLICERLASKEACAELNYCEELKIQSTSQLDCLYDEIRPAIEEREWECQDSVPTTVAEKWIEASCNKLRAEFDLNTAIIKAFAFAPRRAWAHATYQADGGSENGPSA